MKDSGAQPRRRIIGNLHFESELADEELPKPVRRRLAGIATLLRAFAHESDLLWLPSELSVDRVARVDGLPVPQLESGPLNALSAADELLAWGESSHVVQQRGLTNVQEVRLRPGASLAESVWACPPTAAEVAATVNHRAFGFRLAQRLGYTLPGTTLVSSLDELESHLAKGGANFSGTGRWVLKAPLTAAGRDRVIAHDLRRDETMARVRNLFDRFSELLFEPWMTRLADYSSCAIQGENECRVLGIHVQEVDDSGRLRGIGLGIDRPSPELTDKEAGDLREVTLEVGAALRATRYTGPFGIDAWRYRDASGTTRFQALGEVNARMTRGLVTRALVERLREPLAIPGGAWVRLCLTRPAQSTQGRVIPLLHTGDDGVTIALEILP